MCNNRYDNRCGINFRTKVLKFSPRIPTYKRRNSENIILKLTNDISLDRKKCLDIFLVKIT